jgi:hypothetical protein
MAPVRTIPLNQQLIFFQENCKNLFTGGFFSCIMEAEFKKIVIVRVVRCKKWSL